MLLVLAAILAAGGIAAFAIDRRAVHYFREHLQRPFFRFAYHVTDYAKGGPWIIGAALLYIVAQAAIELYRNMPAIRLWSDYALALLISFVFGSVALHVLKIFLGRRRPRDEFEHGLYGFRYFTWQLQYDSFPSGHSMTIFTVAVILAAAIPQLAPLWFLLAGWFALTRALLTAHFLSDVLVGAAMGTLAARETMLFLFAALTPAWF